MESKTALITGITGQDGAYLAEFLLHKGYRVHGMQRRPSLPNTERLHPLLEEHAESGRLQLHYGDLSDTGCLYDILQTVKPDEVYNLAAQSDVAVSFLNPEYTADVNGLGALRLLEAIRILRLGCRYYQASTSELYGTVQEVPQTEKTPFYPCSPYAVSKLFGYWITVNYRESYGLYACNGILFNHESPHRGENFVTRKITRTLTRIFLGLEKCLYLGNFDAKRDWGHARDFVAMQWLILQQESPEDYVIATGKQHSVQEFVTCAAAELGITLFWEGSGSEKRAIVEAVDSPHSHSLTPGMTLVAHDPRFDRPADVNTLLGDSTKAFENLGWVPRISFEEMVEEMVRSDLALAKKEAAETVLA